MLPHGEEGGCARPSPVGPASRADAPEGWSSGNAVGTGNRRSHEVPFLPIQDSRGWPMCSSHVLGTSHRESADMDRVLLGLLDLLGTDQGVVGFHQPSQEWSMTDREGLKLFSETGLLSLSVRGCRRKDGLGCLQEQTGHPTSPLTKRRLP